MYVPLGVNNCAIGWGVPNFVYVIGSDYVAVNAADWSQFAMEIFERCAVSSPVWAKIIIGIQFGRRPHTGYSGQATRFAF